MILSEFVDEFMKTTDPSAWLDRHQGRRDAGLPTVSVLAGPVGLATREARRWAEGRGRPVVAAGGLGAEAVADAWVEAVVAGRDLAGDALAYLGLESGLRVARMSPPELALFLDSATSGEGDAAEAARWLLGRRASGPGLAGRLGGRERAVVALAGLIPPGSGPVVLAIGCDGGVARLALLHPGLTPVLAVAPAELGDYLRTAPESREKALIRSGVVEIGEEGRPPIPVESVPERDDGARSEAERYLAEILARLPETAGLFELNATLDIPFGPGRVMEVDLLARAPRVAVEVDGYHHFQDEEAYRRDRRKDLLLQSAGYLVVRVLAEDVVRHLEDVLSQIRSAVASRRAEVLSPHRDACP